MIVFYRTQHGYNMKFEQTGFNTSSPHPKKGKETDNDIVYLLLKDDIGMQLYKRPLCGKSTQLPLG